MTNIAGMQLKLGKLKTEVTVFRAATSSGHLTSEQVRKLGALLEDIVGILDDLLAKNSGITS